MQQFLPKPQVLFCKGRLLTGNAKLKHQKFLSKLKYNNSLRENKIKCIFDSSSYDKSKCACMHDVKYEVFLIKLSSQENDQYLHVKQEDCRNTTMFVAIGASVGILSAVIHVVALVIAYKRYVY